MIDTRDPLDVRREPQPRSMDGLRRQLEGRNEARHAATARATASSSSSRATSRARCRCRRSRTTLQQALDDWARLAPRLLDAADDLESRQGVAAAFRSIRRPCSRRCRAAYHWADGSAYVTHVELVRKARGAEMPPTFWTDPLMYQGGSDDFIGPTTRRCRADEAWGIDFEAEVAVITDDVPMGTDGRRPARPHQAASCS